MSLEKVLEIYNEDSWGLEDYIVDKTDSDWVQEHKYQYRSYIIKFEDGKFYQINESRSGSYHSDWYYNPAEIFEVERQEKVVTKTEITWHMVGDRVESKPDW